MPTSVDRNCRLSPFILAVFVSLSQKHACQAEESQPLEARETFIARTHEGRSSRNGALGPRPHPSGLCFSFRRPRTRPLPILPQQQTLPVRLPKRPGAVVDLGQDELLRQIGAQPRRRRSAVQRVAVFGRKRNAHCVPERRIAACFLISCNHVPAMPRVVI